MTMLVMAKRTAIAMATVLALGSLPLAAADNLKNGDFDFSEGLTHWKCQAFDPSMNLQPSARNPGEVVSETPGNNFVRLTLAPNEYIPKWCH